MKDDAEANFLRALTALTMEHGLIIGGCGCCGSPFLNEGESANTLIKLDATNARYSMAQGRLTWSTPEDDADHVSEH